MASPATPQKALVMSKFMRKPGSIRTAEAALLRKMHKDAMHGTAAMDYDQENADPNLPRRAPPALSLPCCAELACSPSGLHGSSPARCHHTEPAASSPEPGCGSSKAASTDLLDPIAREIPVSVELAALLSLSFHALAGPHSGTCPTARRLRSRADKYCRYCRRSHVASEETRTASAMCAAACSAVLRRAATCCMRCNMLQRCFGRVRSRPEALAAGSARAGDGGRGRGRVDLDAHRR
jgi:hypothetical protein